MLVNLCLTRVIFAQFDLNVSEGLPTYGHIKKHTHTHTNISDDPDWMGLGGVLTAPTVTTVRGQTETVTQLI